MKMTELHPGMIVELTDRGGRGGKRRVIGRQVKVLATAVKRDKYSSRMDGVLVHHLEKTEGGELVERKHPNGEPWIRTHMARELISVEEAERIRVEREQAAKEGLRRARENDVVEEFLELQVAMRLGISPDHVSALVTRDQELDEPKPWKISIDGVGAAAVLANDDDAAMIAAALQDIDPKEFRKLSMDELAARIVGHMRNGGSE